MNNKERAQIFLEMMQYKQKIDVKNIQSDNEDNKDEDEAEDEDSK